jgi:hypothetical protein
MSVTETFRLPFDTTNELARTGGTAPAGVVCTLTDLVTNISVTPADPPVIEGVIVVQKITGAAELVAGHRFRVTVDFTDYPTDNVSAMELIIVAVP